MFSFIIVDKTGNLSECNVDKLENVYKKCGLRKSEDFKKVMVYNDNNGIKIELWGRVVGRNNTKNPFIFKLDTSIKLYGPAALVCIKKDKLENFSIYDYNNIAVVVSGSHTENTTNATNATNATNTTTTTNATNTTNTTNATNTTNVNLTKIEEALDETEKNSEENMSDSELETEEYIYSSEEENNK